MMLVPSIEAFTSGYCRSAATAARATKGRKVRPNPYCAWKDPFNLSRSLATLVMSALCTVVTCAEVCLLNVMCSAIFWRMMLMGSTRMAGGAPDMVAGIAAGTGLGTEAGGAVCTGAATGAGAGAGVEIVAGVLGGAATA